MAAASGADASLIYLIRHAEKPKDGCKGVDENGAADDKSLTPRGWRRAGAWAVYFGPNGQLPPPQHLYACGHQAEKRCAALP